MKQLMSDRSRFKKNMKKTPGLASDALRRIPVEIGEKSVMNTLWLKTTGFKLPGRTRLMLEEFWIPAIFTGILLFCLFQLGLSIYQTHGVEPVKKLQAISAFAS